MTATTRTTANIYQPISLRAVFNHFGVNQRVLIDSILIKDSAGATVRAYGQRDVTFQKDGSYELIVEQGLGAGDYTDLWQVRGATSSFRLTAQFKFTISADPSGAQMREV
jgi:hypothetical protein